MLARGILIERWGKSLLSAIKSSLLLAENADCEIWKEIHIKALTADGQDDMINKPCESHRVIHKWWLFENFTDRQRNSNIHSNVDS